MDFTEFFDRVLFTVAGVEVTIAAFSGIVLVLFILTGLGMFGRRQLDKYVEKQELPNRSKKQIIWFSLISLVLIADLVIIYFTGATPSFYDSENLNIKLSSVLSVILFLVLAHLSDILISGVLVHDYAKGQKTLQDNKESHSSTNPKRLVRPVVYLFVMLLALYTFDGWNDFGETEKLGKINVDLKPSNIVTAILIFFIARLVIWMATEIFLANYYRRKNVDIGSRYAANQLLKYFVFTIALLSIIESLGINLTVVWGGAAALLVGVGLGLQQTFNDLTCGFILLFERTVEVDDVVEFDNMIGVVKKIGVRTSLIETREDITVIVPNSKLVGDYVINWSHYRARSRFKLEIGVAYGTDVDLVKQLLLKITETHDKVMQRPKPFVRFASFGDSALNFELHFWSKELKRIEDVKSDLRFEIYKTFEMNEISIPFPQRDVWIKKEE